MVPENLGVILMTGFMAIGLTALYIKYQDIIGRLSDAEVRVKDLGKEKTDLELKLKTKESELSFVEKERRQAAIRLETAARHLNGDFISPVEHN